MHCFYRDMGSPASNVARTGPRKSLRATFQATYRMYGQQPLSDVEKLDNPANF